MARARSGAIESTVRFGKRLSSGMGSVFATTTSLTLELRSQSAAGPEKTGCVAATITSFAPAS